jgi:hypothetical protein
MKLRIGDLKMGERPKVLYHYTTAQGLIGILKSNTLWASDLQYLNDFSELRYAENLIERKWEEMSGSDTDLVEPLVSSPFERTVNELTGSTSIPFSAYAVCLCEEGDQLSQWRAYTQKGTGYALGFDTKRLGWLHAALIRVIYKPEVQLRRICPLLKKYIADYNAYTERRSLSDQDSLKEKSTEFVINFFKEALPLFFTFKDPAFSEEREWRLVSLRGPSTKVEGLHFREMQGTIVPYVEMKGPRFPTLSGEGEPDDRLPIVEVIQGPLVDPALGEKSLRLLLNKRGYDNVAVHRSKVPIRF